ncbi:hypothetical protein E4T48_02309 [Aureobasidium sp. EXF-10727]|nr:hypothetical protein E4T48_02309 [Aureobasidium sp. EXF-10727]KAI4731403.1 hypothetical protein E4T49_01013 [Aureobasidium sp. EXF-10728]
MPPAITDDEMSDPLSGDEEVLPPKKPATKKSAAKSKAKAAPEEIEQDTDQVNGHVDDDDDDDEEDNADEYVVDKILTHAFDKGKDCLYQVKWLGYEDPADRTWEPEDNLSGAMDVLKAYWDKIGGKPQPKPKTPAKKGTKRKSMAQDTPETTTTSTTKKRARKSIKAVDADEPADDKLSSRPEGSWEDAVQLIDAVEKPDEGEFKGVLMIFLLWEDGTRTQHTAQQCRQKCPQKLLDYYESKLYGTSSKPNRRRRSTNKA